MITPYIFQIVMHIRDEDKSIGDKCNKVGHDSLFSFIELTTESKSKSIILKNRNLLIFLLKGEAVFTSEQSNNRILHEREFLFLQSSRSVMLCMKPNTRIVKLGLRYPVFLSASDSYYNSDGDYINDEPDDIFEIRSMNDHLSLYFDQIELYYQDGMGHHNTLHDLKLRELAFILKEYYSEEICFSCLSDQVVRNSEFKDKVMESYLKARTVVELAEICGYGLKSFQRMFNLHFGETPYQWMRKQMSSHIEAKLKDSSIPIKQIVAEFGFSSVSHFNTYCKKYFGATPKRFRDKSNV
ncbi:MAG: helix-turn-helix domain-containing protein [Bacteroidales bacterium]